MRRARTLRRRGRDSPRRKRPIVFPAPTLTPVNSEPISRRNRCGPIDSKKSLDGIRLPGETRAMEETNHLERRDGARNMQRFYRISVVRDLFGTVLLLREWGRIGVYSRQQAEAMVDDDAARHAAARLAARKRRRGYVPVDEPAC